MIQMFSLEDVTSQMFFFVPINKSGVREKDRQRELWNDSCSSSGCDQLSLDRRMETEGSKEELNLSNCNKIK